MTDLFLTIFNMSLTASYVILIILILRLPLKRAPKIISYALWSVAAFRLLCPISFESLFSLVPINTATIPQNIAYQRIPQINSGISPVDTYVNASLPVPTVYASVNPLQVYIMIAAVLWLWGLITMLIYSVISVVLLKGRLKSAAHMEGNIYVADNLKTPFVLGIFSPRVYIPAGLNEEEKGYIIRHEQTHIRRLDHIIKPLAFFILCLHWFNPLVWIAFKRMSMDMELSCDERVIREMGSGIKKAYSSSLLSLATERRTWNGSPLAFGEGNVKNRIKNVLKYKKSGVWILTASMIIVIAVGGGLMANPITDDTDLSFLNPNSLLSVIADQEKIKVTSSEYGETYLSGIVLANWLDNAENDWQKHQNPPSTEAEASVVINIDEDHDRQITFFNSEPSLVKVVSGKENRYYSIQEEDYHYILEAVRARVISEQSDTAIAEPTEESPQTTLTPVGASWSLEQNLGADMVSLDYASDDIVIFHGYFGLFVYDLNSLQIVRSLDLETLNCQYTQGDDYCEVSVSRDGNMIQLHPMSSKSMYIYQVSDNTLRETIYQEMTDRFNGFVSIDEVIKKNGVGDNKENAAMLGSYSYHAVSFGKDEFGYLSASDWTLGSLSYIRGDRLYVLFDI
jgi:beta-lactamase regulating signal transducer with metallopeptidase domain